MSEENTPEEEQQIAALAQRISGLEAKLAEARAQLLCTHSKLMYARQSFYADRHTQAALISSTVSVQHKDNTQEQSAHPIHIKPLPIHHPLRRKWDLIKGLPDGNTNEKQQRICFSGKHTPGGQLRLFGLLEDGEAWEHYIPFSTLAQSGGLTIGRDPQCADILLPESGVSRAHARIELSHTGLVITDLNSTNGLKINDTVINSYSPQVSLTDGATLHLGHTVLRVEIIYGSAEPHSQPIAL
ncbi:MAG: FHA domain-containing protein [Akkermansia sp.]|nr:FHA domain-containing protein [Akkermansia sp.]